MTLLRTTLCILSACILTTLAISNHSAARIILYNYSIYSGLDYATPGEEKEFKMQSYCGVGDAFRDYPAVQLSEQFFIAPGSSFNNGVLNREDPSEWSKFDGFNVRYVQGGPWCAQNGPYRVKATFPRGETAYYVVACLTKSSTEIVDNYFAYFGSEGRDALNRSVAMRSPDGRICTHFKKVTMRELKKYNPDDGSGCRKFLSASNLRTPHVDYGSGSQRAFELVSSLNNARRDCRFKKYPTFFDVQKLAPGQGWRDSSTQVTVIDVGLGETEIRKQMTVAEPGAYRARICLTRAHGGIVVAQDPLCSGWNPFGVR